LKYFFDEFVENFKIEPERERERDMRTTEREIRITHIERDENNTERERYENNTQRKTEG
jgi:hypothetical protein